MVAGARPASAPVRLLCLDLDGTLLTPEKKVSAASRTAIAEARAAGLALAIASGRNPFNVRELLDELDLPFTAVCLSGAYAVLDRREVARRPLGRARFEAALAVAEECGCYISAAGSDFNYFCGVPDWKPSDGKAFTNYGHCASYQELARAVGGRDVLKAALHGEVDEQYARVRRLLGEVDGIKAAQSDLRWVDVTAPGVSKAGGVAALAEALGISLAEVCAVGDDENDLECLAAVGLGIAMGNALPEAKAAASVVVATNEHDGAAEAIRLAIARS